MEIKWSPNSNWLITTGSPAGDPAQDFGLILVPIETNKKILEVNNTGPIKGLDWSANGGYIGETGPSGVIRIFNAEKLISSFGVTP